MKYYYVRAGNPPFIAFFLLGFFGYIVWATLLMIFLHGTYLLEPGARFSNWTFGPFILPLVLALFYPFIIWWRSTYTMTLDKDKKNITEHQTWRKTRVLAIADIKKIIDNDYFPTTFISYHVPFSENGPRFVNEKFSGIFPRYAIPWNAVEEIQKIDPSIKAERPNVIERLRNNIFNH